MGIQCGVKVLDLLNAGCKIAMETEVYEKGEPDEFTQYLALVTFPGFDTPHYFNFDPPHVGQLWCDFNHWGGNRPRLEPMLKELNIPYTEG